MVNTEAPGDTALALARRKTLPLPLMLTVPALLKLPSVVKLRPLWMVKLPAAAWVAKLVRALAAVLLLRMLEPTPSSRMVAALVTTLAPVNSSVPGPITLYVPPASVVPAKLLKPGQGQ